MSSDTIAFDLDLVMNATTDTGGNVQGVSELLRDVSRTLTQRNPNILASVNINPDVFSNAFSIISDVSINALLDLSDNTYSIFDVDISNIQFDVCGNSLLGAQFQFANIDISAVVSASPGFINNAFNYETDVIKSLIRIFFGPNVPDDILQNSDEFKVSTHILSKDLTESLRTTLTNNIVRFPFSGNHDQATELNNHGAQIIAGFGSFEQQEARVLKILNRINSNLVKYTIPSTDGKYHYRIPFLSGDSLSIHSKIRYENPFGGATAALMLSSSSQAIIDASNTFIIQKPELSNGLVASPPERLAKITFKLIDFSSNLIIPSADISNALANDLSFNYDNALPRSITDVFEADGYVWSWDVDLVESPFTKAFKPGINRLRLAQHIIANPNLTFDMAKYQTFGKNYYTFSGVPEAYTIETSPFNNTVADSSGAFATNFLPLPTLDASANDLIVANPGIRPCIATYDEFLATHTAYVKLTRDSLYPELSQAQQLLVALPSEHDSFMVESIGSGIIQPAKINTVGPFSWVVPGLIKFTPPIIIQREFVDAHWLDASGQEEREWIFDPSGAGWMKESDSHFGGAWNYLLRGQWYNGVQYNYLKTTRRNMVPLINLEDLSGGTPSAEFNNADLPLIATDTFTDPSGITTSTDPSGITTHLSKVITEDASAVGLVLTHSAGTIFNNSIDLSGVDASFAWPSTFDQTHITGEINNAWTRMGYDNNQAFFGFLNTEIKNYATNALSDPTLFIYVNSYTLAPASPAQHAYDTYIAGLDPWDRTPLRSAELFNATVEAIKADPVSFKTYVVTASAFVVSPLKEKIIQAVETFVKRFDHLDDLSQGIEVHAFINDMLNGTGLFDKPLPAGPIREQLLESWSRGPFNWVRIYNIGPLR